MHEIEEPQHPALLPVIEEYLKKQQVNGEPMRIHLWDTDHDTPEPKQVFADKSLHDLAKKFGAPLYVIEAADSTAAHSITPTSIDDSKRMKAFNKFSALASSENPIVQIITYQLYDDFTASENPTKIIYPDSREKDRETQLSKQEKAIILKSKELEQQAWKEAFERRKEKNLKISKIFSDIFDNNFSKEEKKLLEVAAKKHNIIMFGEEGFDTSAMDEKIANNINAVFDPNKHVQLTIYGAGHFTKKYDLNERMPGLSIAIANKNHMEPTQDIVHTYGNKIHNQFPDYTYYANEKRLVKMDNDAAKAEFLGLNAEQFKAWELGKKIEEPVKLPSKNVDIQSSLSIPPAYSLPIKTANQQANINV